MHRTTPVAFALAALLLPDRTASADDIPCPVQQATWAVITPLPDPWSATVEVGKLTKRVSAFINGREWIICRYSNDNDADQRSVLRYMRLPDKYEARIVRPSFTDVPLDDINCPVENVTVGLKTAVPSPWTSTRYVFRYVAKGGDGNGNMVCYYWSVREDIWGAGPSSILRPVKPDTGPGLTATPKPTPPRPSTLTTEFAATAVTLSTEAAVRTACPATVKFRGFVTANGEGIVRYRVVHNGSQGSPKEIRFDRASSLPVLFAFEVGGDRSGSITARPRPAAPGSIAAAPVPENRHVGWARIEILAPRGGVLRSEDASYAVTCTPNPPDRLKK